MAKNWSTWFKDDPYVEKDRSKYEMCQRNFEAEKYFKTSHGWAKKCISKYST